MKIADQLGDSCGLPADPMVVIAIIAILAAILLPALSLAKERGRRAVCMSNLRQIGIATIVYADAYNDFPPTGRWTSSNPLPGEPTMTIANLWGWVIRLESAS